MLLFKNAGSSSELVHDPIFLQGQLFIAIL